MVTELAIYAGSWLMMFFSVFVIFQTAGVNLMPAWAQSRAFMVGVLVVAIAASNVILTQ